MSSSGVMVEDSVVSDYETLKKGTFNTLICGLRRNLDMIVPDFRGTLTHDELLNRLPQDDPRYVVYDFPFSTGEGQVQRSKITLINWCPVGTPVRVKPVHSSGYSTLQRALDGVSVYVQAIDLSDVGYDELVSRAS